MFGGIFDYVAMGAIGLSVAWGGYQSIQAKTFEVRYEQKRAELGRALGSLDTCANRIENIREAAESNATIPDDLADFVVPDEWLLGETSGDSSATD